MCVEAAEKFSHTALPMHLFVKVGLNLGYSGSTMDIPSGMKLL